MKTQSVDDALCLPEFLDIPDKLLPVIDHFSDYKIFIIEGGRGSGKSQTVARIILYIMGERVVRVVAGREVQNTIEESVYTILVDLINNHALPFSYNKKAVRHSVQGSTVTFKGFRERGAVNVKGVEGADIVWVDEAQALTKPVVDVLLPTLRKDTPVKFIFTLNRLHREDAIMELAKRDDCLHIHIDYFENPHCPGNPPGGSRALPHAWSARDYNHIWLGLPVKAGDEFLFDSDALYASYLITPYGDLFYKQKVIGIDWAAQGSDICVATMLERRERRALDALTQQVQWDEPNTVISVGRILKLINENKPEVVIIDIGGGGYNVYCDLLAANIKSVVIVPFDGGSTKGINSQRNINQRADGYWNLRDWFESRWLCIGEGFRDTLKQLERIKIKFRPDGRNQVREKIEYKTEHGHSPDEADSLMMAVYGIRFLAQAASARRKDGPSSGITRKTGMKRRV